MNFVSLFSGCGGLDLGVVQAGFMPLFSVEWDPHASDSLKAWSEKEGFNHPVMVQDVRTLTPEEILATTHLKSGELDLLVGGPPCQAFSAIGKRQGLADERGLLLFEMIRFAQVIQPRAMLIEQVKGLTNIRIEESGRLALDVFLEQLQKLGYSANSKVLKAVDYGVPQMRERLFIVAFKEGYEYQFPDPQYTDPTKADMFAKPYVTIKEALQGLPDPELKNSEHEPLVPNHIDVTPDRDRERIHGVPEGEWLSKQLHLPESQRRNLGKKDTTKYRRLHSDQPSLTLRGGEIFFHPFKDRYLTPREYLRIHGYPDWFELRGPVRSRSGTYKKLDQHRQVANSVPPPLAKVLASSIKATLERNTHLVESF